MKLRYDWNRYPEIINMFLKIYTNTRRNLELKNMDITYAYEFCSDLEEYMNYFRESGYDIKKINEILKPLSYIDFFKNSLKMDNNIIYITQEQVRKKDDVIYLNENIQEDKRLNERERRRLYLYKGLNKYLFNFTSDKAKEFSKNYSQLFDEQSDREINEAIVNNGWLLLEEVLSQELAERITYDTLGRERPDFRIGIEPMDEYPITDSKVVSRLEQNRPFEELAVRFGGTISGIGSLKDHSEAKLMDDLIDKALKHDFSDSVISEYTFNKNEIELYVILYNMGLLINEKYAAYGNRLVKEKITNPEEVNRIYDNLTYMMNRLFTLDQDEYSDVPLNKVKNSIFIKERLNKELK